VTGDEASSSRSHFSELVLAGKRNQQRLGLALKTEGGNDKSQWNER
jgi:hypothetical protein